MAREEKRRRVDLFRRELLRNSAVIGGATGFGLTDVASASGSSEMQNNALFSDDFEDDLSAWGTSTTSNADVMIDGGRMRLRVYRGNTAIAERSLGTVEGTLTVSFDWENLAEEWYELTHWHLHDGDGNAIDYEVVGGEDVSQPGYSGNENGSVTVEAAVDGPVTLQFAVEPSSYCRATN